MIPSLIQAISVRCQTFFGVNLSLESLSWNILPAALINKDCTVVVENICLLHTIKIICEGLRKEEPLSIIPMFLRKVGNLLLIRLAYKKKKKKGYFELWLAYICI